MQIWRSKSSPNHKTPLALTIGNFDGVHLGHQAILSRLKETADKLGIAACVMTFEPHPREFFAPDQAPTRLTSFREKLLQLARSKVDYVRVYRFNYDFAKISPEAFIERILNHELSVRWLLIGDDFRFGARRAGDFALLEALSAQNGFEVEKMPSFLIGDQRVSSSQIRKMLDSGDLHTAQRFLGRPFSISGRVIDGDKLGKKLGFPTANIQIRHNRPPVSGIFAVNVYGAVQANPSVVLQGVASLGVRPTVHKNGKPVLEVHLFNFDQSIYGHHLQVDFLHKLRDEEKYPDLETLVHQIRKDIEHAKHFFNQANDN
ncbi:bifunctional riboflavin kinase/FAD synthetase [Nitrosomonas sp.]|uniref:bifunctional riboflavin kinase/FAD synthetase n=1 Tax=Nitrosomonas sp. TaxID=42353 RepID=UPI002840D49C|nr:bifunctional riboflavin kinase/FAD synthetase [Nitrosomonas sp.]MCP5291701.1 bifunctional riboflavin kinase/FAD synthetase [Burkholderiales bacterium]MDR4514473.1 bifunctional riboflavin kinase/FAD synthetase [Nitrosomonas sp.]